MKNTNVSDNEHPKSVKVENPINSYVCSCVRRLRIQRGLRVMDMARRTGIPLGSYSCLETGRYRISLENLFRILSVLKVAISEVFPAPADLGAGGQVTGEVITRAVERADRERPWLPEIEDVLDAVCRVFAVDRSDLAGPSRRRPLKEARHIAAQIVQETPHLTLAALAQELNRSISTFSHSLRRKSPLPAGELGRKLRLVRKLLRQADERGTARSRGRRGL